MGSTNAPGDSEPTFVFRRQDFSDGQTGAFPEDLRRWQPAVRLVRTVSDATDSLTPGTAPNAVTRALARVVLWCLVTGRYASWDMETLSAEEPLAHHLSAGLSLTHTDLHRFRREHEAALTAALSRLLHQVAAEGPAPRDTAACDAEAARRYEQARFADSRIHS
ncbi:MAG: hypothetical protein J0L84_15350 [Verrucomicrobia bacterium]|nr:hypothetical protein [Verrucomicrobiota bacterium]